MRIVLIDNYDSFTYNILHLLRELGADAEVHRNDQITLDEVARYDKIILSPGPGIPEEAGILLPLIQTYAPSKPILGICLGEQAIGQAFGAELQNLSSVFHGVQSTVRVTADNPLLGQVGQSYRVGRYHSWVVSDEHFPSCLEVLARDEEDQLIMALRHRTYPAYGIQFHPESVLTPKGKEMIQHWLEMK